VDRLGDFLQSQRARLESKELKPAEILGEREGAENDGGSAAAERAAWTLVARALLNLDESITKQ